MRNVWVAFLLCWALPAVAVDGGWRQDLTDQGVTVGVKDEPGRNLPVFRGTGTVDASVFELLAILDDAGRHCDWMPNCAGSQLLKKTSDWDRIEYHRTSAPFPVSDRDVVVHSVVTGNVDKQEVWARFDATSLAGHGPVDGAVRMPRLRGYYLLQALDAQRSRVTYQIDADPGGMLPDWLARLASRKLPVQTIVGLRKQAAKMRGKYAAFLAKYDPAHGGTIPADVAK